MKDFQHARQRCKKDCGDLSAAEITSRENENSRVTGSQSGDFQRTIAQSLIFGEYYPSACPHRLQPNLIVLIALEVVIVNLDGEPGLDEFGRDRFYAE